jgi:hypothetical protein
MGFNSGFKGLNIPTTYEVLYKMYAHVNLNKSYYSMYNGKERTWHGVPLINEVVLYILLSRNNYDDNGETLILRVN